MKRLILIAALGMTALPVAQPAHAACSSQLVNSVQRDLRSVRANVDARQISCNGLAQLHLLFSRSSLNANDNEMRQRAFAVLRREGLTR